ncbi:MULTISPECIES: hypothetical protein [Pseudomonas]|uniref:DUF904 domain-containing protein n=1 Tax=Pseudomonas nitroreducens TaxID=46680 RepID=A0A6G6J696_PSENT|nr:MULTISPECIES: hypothetical protein [Pseudomonas]MBG6291895.1 hypothetical protein [Pseudomonas nitroreducens]MCE4067672.1 hypothetical protein [Pseudomonas nitritireducens]MCE4076861.1 hypothetical protein [Pseudomonas nitroreducens]MCJ1879318.1 hypothetical protein [Pseudomonas nitroreducens]MCJ1895868.1 hypothetical protein [Pseudomonas nitroreducens]
MLDSTLEQLEQLVAELLQQNEVLVQDNAQVREELLKAREENDTLQLSLMEQEEKHNATATRLQALIRRVSDSRASA